MNILGLNLEEFCSAAVMRDGQLIAACSEERFQGEKCYSGFPQKSIDYCLKEAGLKQEDIDLVAVARFGTSIINFAYSYVQRRSRFTVKDYVKEACDYWYPMLYEGKNVNYLDVFKDKIDLKTFPKQFNDYFFKNIDKYWQAGVEDIMKLKKRLILMYLPHISEDKIKFYNHHEVHAFYGYYVSKFAKEKSPTLVVTADSFGDFENGMISKFDNGSFDILHLVNNHNLGRVFRNMTLYLGMKPYEHEYKVMGLAPYVPKRLSKAAYDVFDRTMDVAGLNFYYKENPPDNYFWFKKRLEGIRFDAVAAGLQRYFEDRLQKWITNAVVEYKVRNVAFSGGLAMNIKSNMKIAQSKEVNDFFVSASPDDNSHCIGVCFLALHKELKQKKKDMSMIKPLDSMYLGPRVGKTEIKKIINRHKLKNFCKITENVSADFIADKLMNGIVIGRCVGRMEFGARALGNRSILADPRDAGIIDRINKIIKRRDFWMPFSPVIIDTYWNKYLLNKSNISSPFMMVGFDTTRIGQKDIPAAVHPTDKTTRPQMLIREANPDFYDLIDGFERKTGVGALLNTSFNLHGFPIVCGAEDAVKVFEDSDLDAVLLNDIYIEKKKLVL